MKKLLIVLSVLATLSARSTERSATLQSFNDVPPGTLNNNQLILAGINSYVLKINGTNAPTSRWPYNFSFVSGAPGTTTTIVVEMCTHINTQLTNTFTLTAFGVTPGPTSLGRYRITHHYK